MEGLKRYEIFVREAGEGRAFYGIIQAAREESADLIVMGTHGRTGFDHLLLGSTAENVGRKSPCPVLTVRSPGSNSSCPQDRIWRTLIMKDGAVRLDWSNPSC
jgi:Universal stress protein family